MMLKSDVMNTDKQDDGAATRLFNAQPLLAALAAGTEDESGEIPQELVGIFVYLFVFGEYPLHSIRIFCVGANRS